MLSESGVIVAVWAVSPSAKTREVGESVISLLSLSVVVRVTVVPPAGAGVESVTSRFTAGSPSLITALLVPLIAMLMDP